MGAVRPFFVMRGNVRNLTRAAVFGALYIILTHLQNFLLPGSASMAIQFRVSEAMCVLAFFTPAAVPGLGIGCLLFNLTSGVALPLDFLVGTAATVLATGAMWKLRRCPFLGLWMPAIANGLLVGWELTVFVGGGFWINALYVFIGEAAVLLTLGWMLFGVLRSRSGRSVY